MLRSILILPLSAPRSSITLPPSYLIIHKISCPHFRRHSSVLSAATQEHPWKSSGPRRRGYRRSDPSRVTVRACTFCVYVWMAWHNYGQYWRGRTRPEWTCEWCHWEDRRRQNGRHLSLKIRRNAEVEGRQAYTLEYYLPYKHATAVLPPGLAILYCYAQFRTDSAASARTVQWTGLICHSCVLATVQSHTDSNTDCHGNQGMTHSFKR